MDDGLQVGWGIIVHHENGDPEMSIQLVH